MTLRRGQASYDFNTSSTLPVGAPIDINPENLNKPRYSIDFVEPTGGGSAPITDYVSKMYGGTFDALVGYTTQLAITDNKNLTTKKYVDDAITAAIGGSIDYSLARPFFSAAASPLTYTEATGEFAINTDLSLYNNATSGFITDYTVTESDVTAHEAALSITTSQITDWAFNTWFDARFATSNLSSLGTKNHDDLTGISTGGSGNWHLSLTQYTSATRYATAAQDGLISSIDWNTFNTQSNLWTISGSDIYRATGKVGIGLAPSYGFDAIGNDGMAIISSTSTNITTKYTRIGVRHYSTTYKPFIPIFGSSTATENALIIGGGTPLGTDASYIAFRTTTDYTKDSGTGFDNEIMRVTPSGLGIGIASPSYPFHIYKAASTGVDGEVALATIATDGTGLLMGYRVLSSVVNGGFIRSTGSLPLYLGTTNRQRTITIADSAYMVGIAQTSPAYTLDIGGTLHTTSATTLGSTLSVASYSTLTGSTGVGGAYATNVALKIYQSSTYGIFSSSTINDITSAKCNDYRMLSLNQSANANFDNYYIYQAFRPGFATGVTNTSGHRGIYLVHQRNSNSSFTDDNGTLGSLHGMGIYYGHARTNAASPVTGSAFGLLIKPSRASGTITGMYDIYLDAEVTGGTVTNAYGIYQANSKANYFAGSLTTNSSLTVGTTAYVTNYAAIGIALDSAVTLKVDQSTRTFGIYAYANTTNQTNTINQQNRNQTTATVTGTYYSYAVQGLVYPKVASGVTNSGFSRAFHGEALRNYDASYNDSGTLGVIAGCSLNYGHYNLNASATPITTTVYGLHLYPYYTKGTITTLYDIYIGDGSSGGTITNRYSIYQQNTTAKNVFFGKTGVGAVPSGTYNLEVTGTAKVSGVAYLGNTSRIVGTGTGTSNLAYFLFCDSGGSSYQGFVGKVSGLTDMISLYGAAGIGLGLGTNDTRAITIDTSQNVGVGTTSPTYKMHIVGTFRCTDVARMYSGSYIMGTDTSSYTSILNIADSNSTIIGDIGKPTLGSTNIQVRALTTGGGVGIYTNNETTTPVIYADSSYNVGIGDSTPSYKLDVNGTFRAVGAGNFDDDLTVGSSGKTFTLNGVGIIKFDADATLSADSDSYIPTQKAVKAYVDSAAFGYNWLPYTIRTATTANITISTALNNGDTLDGITLATNDYVLVKDQSTASENGIYIVQASPARATFMNDAAEFRGTACLIKEGTVNVGSSWLCTSTVVTVGVDAVTFAKIGQSASYTFSNGLKLTGSTVTVLNDGSTITVGAAGIKVSATYPGNTSLVTLGTVTTGTWNATAITVAKGGTGKTSYTIGDILYATGATTLAAIPPNSTATRKFLKQVSSSSSWDTLLPEDTILTVSGIVATLTSGGTILGANTAGGAIELITTGTGAIVGGTSPTITSPVLVTPNLGTPTTGVLSSCTGYSISNITGLGADVEGFLTSPSSSSLYSALTTSTGTGLVVFGTNPTITSPILVTPNLGTPSAGTLTNCTIPIGKVTGLGTGVDTFLITPSSANLYSALTDSTGTGLIVFNNGPTLIDPVLGTPTSGTLTKCTGLPITTGITGIDADVLTWLQTPTSANLEASVDTSHTGTGSLVFHDTPTFSTPVLGVATATSINALTLAAQADGFTIAGGTTSRTLTVTGAHKSLNGAGASLTLNTSKIFSGTTGTITLGSGTSNMTFLPGTGTITINNGSYAVTLTASGTVTGATIPASASTYTLAVTNGSTLSGGQTITNTTIGTNCGWNGAVIAAIYGGTGLTSYTTGDIIYANTSSSLTKLHAVATGSALISEGVGTAPSWGKIGMATHVTGVLLPTNGGTGIANSNSYTLTILNAAKTLSGTGGTISIGGTLTTAAAFTTSGAYSLTLTTTNTTNVTLPISGTLLARESFQSLSPSATVSWDVAVKGTNVTLNQGSTGNFTLTISNVADGMYGNLKLTTSITTSITSVTVTKVGGGTLVKYINGSFAGLDAGRYNIAWAADLASIDFNIAPYIVL